MTDPIAMPTEPPAGFPAAQRLMLAGAASAALLTLGWAGLTVRGLRQETQQLRRELAAARSMRVEPEGDTRAAAEPGARLNQPGGAASAREAELQGIIRFLQEEVAAAQRTIERLRRAEAAPSGERPREAGGGAGK